MSESGFSGWKDVLDKRLKSWSSWSSFHPTYPAINFSMKKIKHIGDKPKEPLHPFPGFDGNNETKQLVYARYFMEKLNRFNELWANKGEIVLNSHWPMLEKYRTMLKKWNKRNELTEDEIQEILSS